MTSKEDFLANIHQHTVQTFPCPDLSKLEAEALTFADPVAQFAESQKLSGGHCLILPEGKSLAQAVAEAYPDVHRIANTLAQLDHAELLPGEVFNPDEVSAPAELNGTDLAIIESQLGVAENACCWIEQHVRHRAIYFIAEALVIVLRRQDIVSNMHEAYRRLPDSPSVPFACFISGPSKTADIEQALVFGAHGAKDVTVIII